LLPPPLWGRDRGWRGRRLLRHRGKRGNLVNLGGARCLLDEALEAAREHLAHHAVVVPRRELRRADVELAVLIPPEPLGTGDDHGADGVRALDLAVVIDLDATRSA